MFPVPLTYYFDFATCKEAMYPLVMEEFSANGARHIVLTDTLIDGITRGESNIGKIEKYMQESGLTFCDAHSLFGMEWCLYAVNGRLKNALVNQMKLALDICEYFQVKTITAHMGPIGNPATEGTPLETYIGNIQDSLAELLPYAEKRDVVICIENIWHPDSTPEVLLEMKKNFPTPYLGFCYDAGHANIMDKSRYSRNEGRAWACWTAYGAEEPPWEDQALEKMLPYIVNCHLHDNNGIADEHTLPGRGNINWDHILPLLVKAPNLKVIQSEVIPVKNGISIPLLCKTFEKMGRDLSLK